MKGVGFVNVKKYVSTLYGSAAWQNVLSALPAEDRETADFGLAVGWYDVAAFGRLLRVVDRICGEGDLALLQKIGAYEAEQDFNRVYRIILRTLTPGSFLSAERRIWKQFQDSGDWNWNYVDGGIRAVLTGWEVDRALCVEMGGYLVRVIEFTGGRQVSFDHTECRARRSEQCVFVLRWR
jgi:hypothetical protein